jgi:hypothetical protein
VDPLSLLPSRRSIYFPDPVVLAPHSDCSPWSMSNADNAEAVQEFEAKRGVSDPPEERASRSKDSGRRPSAGTSIGENEEDGDEDEYQTGPKANVSLSTMIYESGL